MSPDSAASPDSTGRPDPAGERAPLLRLVVAVVRHDAAELARWAAEHGQGPAGRAVHEALLQCHLFCGFPRTLAALDALRAAGVSLDPIRDEPPPDPLPDAGTADETARGAALFDRIYGSGSGAVREHLSRLSPTLADWIASHAYGRTLSRPGLDAATRELLAVVALAATGHDRQLASHARGAVRCGATREDVLAALEATRDLIPEPRLERAIEVAVQFASAASASAASASADAPETS